MSILNYNFYSKKIELLNDKYWLKSKDVRWNYMKPVLRMIEELNPKTAIELGTNKISLLDFSDSMSLEKETIDPDNLKNNIYILDARNTPWPIEDKKYDLFIGLQVLEHLTPNQINVFNEIKRISKNAIISLPYNWDCPNDYEHHMINDEKILEWTSGLLPSEKQIKSSRIILRYNF